MSHLYENRKQCNAATTNSLYICAWVIVTPCFLGNFSCT